MIANIRRHALVAATGTTLALTLSACFFEAVETHEPESYDPVGSFDYRPIDLSPLTQTCAEPADPAAKQATPYCYEDDDYKWRTSCRTSACQEVKVFTHYMLPDDLAGDYVVNVEAFDNAHFQGSPVGSVQLSSFPARRGEWREAQLFLEPGEYYLRAYMMEESSAVVPYTLGGMTLVADQPVGVFGAVSGAEMVRVAPRDQDLYPAPVHIYLDKLFKKPGTEPETNAHIRISLKVAEGYDIPDGRQLRVRLHETSDLAQAPVYDFAMATEMLLIQGRVGQAEYVTPSIAEGTYVVFAFLDANGNELLDDEEPSAVHKVDNLVTAVAARKNRTESITLTLGGTVPAGARE